MRLHGNAKTCPASRRLMCERVREQGWSIKDAAEAAGVSERTCQKWLSRFDQEGLGGLSDRSSAPHRQPNRTPSMVEAAVCALRRLRMTSTEIAVVLSMAVSTVGVVLTRHGLNRHRAMDAPEPPNRYQRRRPGELVHIDIKKLGRIERPGHRVHGDRRTRARGAGWEYVHVAVDDRSRLAFAQVLTNERATSCVAFLEAVVAHFGALGVTVEAVMTDNGPGYKSLDWAAACRRLGLRHLRTRPYRPRTNGKAERFIRTMLTEWAYKRVYATSLERTVALDTWLDWYNNQRPHAALRRRTPATQLDQS